MNELFDVPGFVCPFCGADCSPISAEVCGHYFLTDGENGWRFTEAARSLYDAANAKEPTLFRDLLYHAEDCRRFLRLRRAVYDDSLEIYVFTSDAATTIAAFQQAIGGANRAK
jgi:sarcosine oxidase delta subunit